MSDLVLKVKYLEDQKENLAMPRPGDIGIDIVSNEDKFIKLGTEELISTGLHLEIPDGYWGQLVDRSSVSKWCHTFAGVLDPSFRGLVKVRLFCHTPKININCWTQGPAAFREYKSGYEILKGDRIAQLIIHKSYNELLRIEEVSSLSDTERGEGGFGSTGK